MLKKQIISDLMEYFYYHQYQFDYYPSYDRWSEVDVEKGQLYYCYSIFN